MIRLCPDFATVVGLGKAALQIRLQALRLSLPLLDMRPRACGVLCVVGVPIELP
jgi:hypothetical protein